MRLNIKLLFSHLILFLLNEIKHKVPNFLINMKTVFANEDEPQIPFSQLGGDFVSQ